MIPKKIHYCWFGPNELPELAIKCIESWEKYFPDYSIYRWDETNSLLNKEFVQEAYKNKKWAFVSDYIRCWVLYNEGGIYLDVDMLILKNMDSFLTNSCFFGCEREEIVSCGIIGCVP